MKPVALYIHRLGEKGGGAERIVCELANALASRDFVVHVATWDEPCATSFYPISAGVRWHRLGFRPGAIDKLRRTSALSTCLREHRIKVLIGFVMSGDRSVFAAAKMEGVKLIAAERNAPDFYEYRYGRTQRLITFACLHLANRITVQFPDYVHGYPASLRRRIEVIPNPVALANRQAHPGQPNAAGRFTLLSVGRLDLIQKRPHTLVGAFATIARSHPHWDLLIIGDGPAKESLTTLALRCGVADRVRIEPSTRDIFQMYAQAHLFAIPSRWEGFPNALAEALAHGLPAIGFRHAPGVPQLLVEGESGWLAPNIDDEITFGKCLTEAMSNAEERVRRGAFAAQSMLKFDSRLALDRWAYVIGSVLRS
jgi:glycosyltransferase involved in cell wall biosynthesis